MGPKPKIMVLAGGPDREREVSLESGRQITAALDQAGSGSYEVCNRDIGPDDLSALDEFVAWGGDGLFLALHGSWGEGGALQRILDERGLPYFGCDAAAATLCMNKAATKDALGKAGLPTPAYEVLGPADAIHLRAPLVIKPILEGSSIGVAICKTDDVARQRFAELSKTYDQLLIEQFIDGMELTVGVIGGPDGDQPLPVVQIIPATEFYDYEAKYIRDDTRYVFDLPISAELKARIEQLGLRTHQALGCRHLSRVDIMLDRHQRPWVIEVNTIPGFTSHSLVPKAAAHAGIGWVELVDRLAKLAMQPTVR